MLCVTIWQTLAQTLLLSTGRIHYPLLRHESGPALPGISYSSGEHVIPGVIEGRTYHTNIVTVEQRLSKLCLLLALRRRLAERIQIKWSFLRA